MEKRQGKQKSELQSHFTQQAVTFHQLLLLGPRLWLGAGAGRRADLQDDTHNVGGLNIR